MLSADENHQVEIAVRTLLAQPTITGAGVAQLLSSLPQRADVMERVLEIAHDARWVGMPLLEAAVSRLGDLPAGAQVESGTAMFQRATGPRRPAPPPGLAGNTPLPGRAAAPLIEVPVEVPVEVAVEVAVEPPLPAPVPEPAPTPAGGTSMRTSNPGVRFATTTGKYRTIVDNTPDLPPLKPGVDPAAPPSPRTTGRMRVDSAPARKTRRISLPPAPPTPLAHKYAAAALGFVLLGAAGFAFREPAAANLSRSQDARKGKAPSPAAVLPVPTGPVDVEGTVVATEPGRIIIKTADRFYLIRGETFKVAIGARFRARGMQSGVGHGGVVFVDPQA